MAPRGDPRSPHLTSGQIPAVLYGAKSTTDKHDSIPTQLAEAREMAERNGWVVVFEDHDEGFSAYSGNRGPALERCKRAAAEAASKYGKTAMFIAQAHDRFARGAGDRPGAPQSLGELWHEMRRKDVWLRTVEDDEELRDEASVAAIGRRAHIDSRRKSKSVRKGMKRRTAQGLHNGRAVYGYAYEGGRWIIYPHEAEVVRRVFAEWVGGASQRSITQRLNVDGIRTQRAGEWSQGTVSKLLRNVSYTGTNDVGKPCGCGHEPIVAPEIFEQAKLLLGGRHTEGGPNRRTAGGHLFLNGFLRCGLCGSAYGPRSDKRRGYETYECQRPRNYGAGACSMPSVRRERLERAVVEHFMRTRLDVDAMREEYADSVARRIAEVVARRAEAERGAMRAVDRLARVKRDYQDGRLDAEDWREQRRELTADVNAANAEVERLAAQENELRKLDHGRDTEAEVLHFLSTVRETILAPVRDADTLDALRAGFRRVYRHFHVYPAGSTWAVALAGDAGARCLVVAPTSAEGVFLGTGFGELKVALPVPANSYAEGLDT
jgi:site-specific DNA recombinase